VTPEDVAAFERCVAAGGVVLFPADTVYGLATDPESRAGVERLYALKGRPQDRPAAVMFFSMASALQALPELGPRTRAVFDGLLPGAVTVLVPNPRRRFRLACGREPERLGVRVPDLEGALAPLAAVERPVLQSSANPTGAAEARRVADVHERLRTHVDFVLDGGELPGTPSTVVDLTRFEDAGQYEVVREGAVSADRVESLLR
jgi:L-threonylcarbamoyladenylate synthase